MFYPTFLEIPCYLSVFSEPKSIQFTLDSTKTYQKIMGFGGAFTDSSGINILSLGKKTQEHLLR